MLFSFIHNLNESPCLFKVKEKIYSAKLKDGWGVAEVRVEENIEEATNKPPIKTRYCLRLRNTCKLQPHLLREICNPCTTKYYLVQVRLQKQSILQTCCFLATSWLLGSGFQSFCLSKLHFSFSCLYP